MKLLYLGSLCDDTVFNDIIEEGFQLSQAAFKLERQLVKNLVNENLIDRNDMTIISSLPFKDVMPKVSNTEIFDIKTEYIWNNRNDSKDLFRSWKMASRKIEEWEKATRNEKRIVLTYATDLVLLFPMLRCRKKHKDIKIITICSEIPKFRNYSYTSSLKGTVLRKAYTYLNESMDGYIFLTKYMNEVCNKKEKPWLVVEGLPEIVEIEPKQYTNSQKETIVYAGGFDKGYGIEELLQAMGKLRHENAKLLICGNGELLECIKEQQKKCKNICYMGILPNSEVMEMEREAAILINPRKSDLMLTRYSFPSKTLEYFSNGKAVTLLTRLDGIPEEYYEYCFIIEEVTPESIAEKIDFILDMPMEHRDAIAHDAYEFVKNKKSAKAQVKRIYDFLLTI